MAEGFALNIDSSFLQNLEKVDKKMADLLDKSNALSKSVVSAFQQMSTQGVEPYLRKLQEQKSALEAIKNIDITGNNDKRLKNLQSEVTKTVDDINKLISAIEKTPQFKSFSTQQYNNYELQLFLENQDKKKRAEQDMVAIQERNRKQYIRELEEMFKREDASDKQRYELWLMRKHSEQVEHKRAEDAKLKATQDAIAKQNSMFAQLETYRQQSTQAKNNSIQAKQAYEQQYRDYERLFTEAIQREERLRQQAANAEMQRVIEIQDRKKRAEQDIRAIEQRTHNQRQKEYEEMFRKIDELAKRQSAMRSSKYQRTQQYGDTSGQAIASFNRLYSDKGLKTLNYMNITLQQLQQAQSKVNLKTQEGVKQYDELNKRIKALQRQINATTNSINNMGKSHRGLMDTAGQLARQLALVFSVSAIQGYIGKLVQVRSEFELQQKSLQVLLQNKDEANRLWQQTIDLAVKSPFRVKELVSYTRQLAAYRIENEKLHDTTRMLADVSAGLGVNMNRIILAFGQVRAANYLRGTELRQFTEAGIPMLDELAKLFTELEGRMVSAGDVFERISKRMVTFGVVEEVFNRMTSAGGVFYKMQEEQSKTLQGMISNLHDSIDLMLNDIGQSKDGVLKGSVDAVRTFVENWKEVAFWLEKVVLGMAVWKVGSLAFASGIKKAATTTLWWNTALKSNIGSSMAMIQSLKWSEAALVGVTKRQLILGKATLYLQGVVRGLGVALKTILPLALIGGLMELYRVTTRASREAKELQKALNEIYKEDTKNLKQQTDTFKDLVERLKSVNVGSKEHSDIISKLNSQYGEHLGFLVTEKTTYDDLATSIDSVVMALSQKAKANTLEKALAKSLESSGKEIEKWQEKASERMQKLARPNGKANLVVQEDEINDIFNEYERRVREAGNLDAFDDIEKFEKFLSEYYGEPVNLIDNYSYTEFLTIGQKILDQKKEEEKIQQKINNLYGEGVYSTLEYRKRMQALNDERKKALENEKTRIGKDKIEYDYLVKKTQLEGENQGLDQSVIDANIAKIRKTSETIQDINRQIIESTDELGQEAVDRVYITAQDASQGTNAIAENMAASYKSMQEEIKQQNALKEAGTVHDQAALDNAEMMSKAYYRVLEIMGRLDLLESKGDKKNKEAKILKNRISLVEQLYKEYTKLNEKFGAKEAEEQVRKAFGDTFKEAFEGTGINLSGLIVDKERLSELQQAGDDAGQAFSDAMLSKMNDVAERGTYIREFAKDTIDFITSNEGKPILKAKDVEGLGKGYTIGYGEYGEYKDTKKKIQAGDTITQEEAVERFTNIVLPKYRDALNKVLDANNDLIFTQEQYNALLDLTYQGSERAAINLIKYARDEAKGIEHINQIRKKYADTFGEEEAESKFGESFVNKFKEAENIYEKMALLLKTMNLTVDGVIRKDLPGMITRSEKRYSLFSGDLDVIEVLRKSAIDVSQIDFTNIEGVIAILKKLVPIAEKEGKEAQLTLSRAISDKEVEIGVKTKVEEDKALIDQIEDMFSGYEMSIELQKLNIPPDLAKQLFGIDSIDLSGLKSRVEGLQSLFLGTDLESKYKEYLQKISEMEDKEQVERLKSYTKYIVKAQSERARITFEALEKIRKAEEMYQQGRFTKSEMNNIRENINNERDKELADLAFNEFKNSDLYLKMFEDFDSVSIPVLEAMKKRVENLRNSLKELGASSEDVKNLTQQLEKIDDAIQERNPFKDLFKNIKEYRKLQGDRGKTESEYKEKLEENEKLTKALAEASKEVGIAKSEYNKAMEQATENQALKNAQSELDIAKARLAVEINANGAETQKAITLQQEVEKKQQAYDVTYKTLVLEDKSVKTAKERLDNAHKAEESAKNALNKSNTDLSALLAKLKEMEELSEKVAATLQFVGQVFQELASTVTDVASSLENVFGAMDAKTSDTVSSISEILGGLGNTASGVARVMSNPMDIGGYFQAIRGLASTIGSIFAIGDKKKERQIQREIKFVEDLEKAYEKLEKQIDEAYTIDTLKRSYDNAQKNLNDQIAARQRMIQQEEDKKKTDKDRIKEWQQEIEDLREQQKELLKTQVEELGGGYDYSSMTEEFVDAWLSAYEEAGDGLKGLEDNFDDFFKNIAIKQAVMGGASKILEPFFNEVNKALEDDFKLDDSEMATIDRLGEQAKVNLDEFLKQWYGKWGEYMGGEGQGELSSLQRGIQGVTEETAQIIEAYMASVRFYVADSNAKLTQLVNQVVGGENTPNPMLSELRTQTELVRGISTLLNSLTSGGHSMGGRGFRVFIS